MVGRCFATQTLLEASRYPCSPATACCSTPTGSSRPGHRRARSSGSTLVCTFLEFQGGRLRDDATLLLLEWNGSSPQVAPQP